MSALQDFEQKLTAVRSAFEALASSAETIDQLTVEDFSDWQLKLWIVQAVHGMKASIASVEADISRLHPVIVGLLPESDPTSE